MSFTVRLCAILGAVCVMAAAVPCARAAPEWNPVPTHGAQIGPEANRLIIGFRASGNNTLVTAIKSRARAQSVRIVQAQTSAADVDNLVQRSGLSVLKSRQLTPSMHVLLLGKTLYGAEVDTALTRLRADAAVEFAEIDQRRYPHALPPNDPLYMPSGGATGQWFMQTPSTLTPASDASATDAISAWAITTGSSGTVIADVDTGIRFDHPDLLRAGLGGRLLPGYDFVDQDYSQAGAALGTFLIANDGDGWDPDPSDPGDWLSSADLMNKVVFPAANCKAQDSSWHGTRVVGVLGALTDNGVGIAGMTWAPYILPVRALGKCGGYDSDIITGMQWAAGLAVGSNVPSNPYPADIINLSLGGSGACPAQYSSVITTLTAMGVTVVASAGNESGPVDVPGNCPGVLTVAGLRNVGTKVGYSSFGAEVGIAAPAGNCVNTSGACLRSIDTTDNTGLTSPGSNSYTNQTVVNLGTSFSAPIVSGVVALMRSVNANLTPAQLMARIKASASPFPQPVGLAQCSAGSTGECACVVGQCGAGMVNALSAVRAAQKPIAAVVIPAKVAVGSPATFDAAGSAASCGRTVTSYAWTATSGIIFDSATNGPQVTVTPGPGMDTLTLTVTDSMGDVDVAAITVTANSASTVAPKSAGTSASACLTPMTVTVSPPTVAESFSPSSVAVNTADTLTLTLTNPNGFVLTQSAITQTLPANLTIAASPAPATTCTGGSKTLTSSSGAVTLANANIPARGSCNITLTVQSNAAGTFTSTIAPAALSTGPAGANIAGASAVLTVTGPAKSGGGAIDVWDLMFVAGVWLAGRRQMARRVAG